MSKIKKMIIVFFGLAIISSCSKEDDVTDESTFDQSPPELNFDNDIIYDDDFTNDQSSNIVAKSVAKNSAFEDTDNDGIADYAESAIDILDPDTPDDLLSMNPATILTITTVNGVQEVPLYKTSYYQENMLKFKISSFRASDPWTDIQKERVTDNFKKIKKVWLTPEFYDYVVNKFSDSKSSAFFTKLKTVTRNVQMRHYRGSASGISNLWSYIGINTWVMSDKYHSHHLPTTLSHEMVHHLGFGHNGLPYGTQNKTRNMIKANKHDYVIFDINKKTNYINPCVPYAAKNNNNYHSIHFLKIPNTGVNIQRHWKGNYEVYSTPVTFTRGQNYKSITQFLNGGRYSIWIDFNDDAEFDDSERVLNNVWTYSRWKKATYDFSIPEDANTGVHRMRILKSTYHTATNSCKYIKGQAIDFTNVTVQ